MLKLAMACQSHKKLHILALCNASATDKVKGLLTQLEGSSLWQAEVALQLRCIDVCEPVIKTMDVKMYL